MRTPRPLTGSQATTATCTGATRHHGIHISDHEVVHFKRQTGVATQGRAGSWGPATHWPPPGCAGRSKGSCVIAACLSEIHTQRSWSSQSRASCRSEVRCPGLAHSDGGVVVHPVGGRQQRTSDRSCVPGCQVLVMVGRQPHADVSILVLHGSHVGRETFVAPQRWPVRPVVFGRPDFPLGMLGVAPARAGCGGHGFSLRLPKGRRRAGGRLLRFGGDRRPVESPRRVHRDHHRPTVSHG